MARTLRDAALVTRSARFRLAPRAKPYWRMLETGLHLGYRRARLKVSCLLGAAGAEIMGHEFHYASALSSSDEPLVECRDATGAPVAEGGGRRGSVSGTFFHFIDRRQP